MKRGVLGKQRVGLTLGEEELPAGEAEGEFVDEAGGEDAAEAEGDVGSGAEDFAAGRIAGDDDGAVVEGVAAEAVLFGAEPAEEDGILIVDGVIDAEQVLGAADLDGGIPLVDAEVQSVAGVVGVGSGIAAEHGFDGLVETEFGGIGTEDVIGGHAVGIGRGAAIADAGGELAGAGID